MSSGHWTHHPCGKENVNRLIFQVNVLAPSQAGDIVITCICLISHYICINVSFLVCKIHTFLNGGFKPFQKDLLLSRVDGRFVFPKKATSGTKVNPWNNRGSPNRLIDGLGCLSK